MKSRRILCAGVALTWVWAGGCRNNNPETKTQSTAAPRPTTGPATAARPPVAAPENTAADDDHGTAEVLAQKAATYAKTVGPLLAKRGSGNPHDAARSDAQKIDASPTTEPAEVVRADPAPARPAVAPATAPAANASTAVASLDTGAGVDVPTPTARPTVVKQQAPPDADALARRLAQRVKDYPQDVAGQLDYQLLQLVSGESVPQLPAMAGLATEDREIVAALLDGLSNFRNAVRADNNLLLSRKIRPMLDVADRLRNQAELSIPTIALCTRVDGFGVYEPIVGERFVAGKEQPVIVYCEVENFSSQLDPKKLWETKLKQEVVLYTEQTGLEVWRDKQTKPIVDLSRNRRHDFFVVKMIKLPATLTIGRYLLKVSVEDEQVSRIAENTVAIQIVAQ